MCPTVNTNVHATKQKPSNSRFKKLTIALILILFIAPIMIPQNVLADTTKTDQGTQTLDTSSEENFTLVVLPDTQYYSESYPTIFDNQTQWIVNEAENLNVVFVTHEGDVINQNLASQWQNANRSMSKLDGQVAWGLLPGNHDGAASGGSLTNFNTFFGYNRFANKIYYGGHYSSSNANNYQLFSGGNDDYLIFHFQYRPSDAVLAWANNTLTSFPDRRVIVVTHDYLNADGSRTTEGNHIWNSFVAPHANQVFLVLCGHNHGEAKRVDTVNGYAIPQLLADYQSRTNGGNGFLRILKFSPSQDKIFVSTFSPYLNSYESDTDSQFELNYDMTNTLTPSTTITSNPQGSGFVKVDGVTITTPQSFNWEAGQTHTIEATTLVPGATGTQYLYTSWTDGGGQTHSYTVPSKPTTITANYKTQYSLTVNSPYGSPQGAGWYDSGNFATFSVTSPATDSTGNQYICTGYSGDATGTGTSGSISINSPKTVTFSWNSQQKWARTWYTYSGNSANPWSRLLGSSPDESNLNFDKNYKTATVAYSRADRIGFVSTRTVSLSAGTWTFTVGGDDGVRLYIDNKLAINGWKNQGYTTYTYTTSFTSTSDHSLRLEWYENTGNARVSFNLKLSTS
jgi:hypothetical protein